MIRTVRRTLEIFPACRWPMALLLRTHVTRSSSLNLPGIATRGWELVRPNTTRKLLLAHRWNYAARPLARLPVCLRRPNIMRKRRETQARLPGDATRVPRL